MKQLERQVKKQVRVGWRELKKSLEKNFVKNGKQYFLETMKGTDLEDVSTLMDELDEKKNTQMIECKFNLRDRIAKCLKLQ